MKKYFLCFFLFIVLRLIVIQFFFHSTYLRSDTQSYVYAINDFACFL